MSQDDVARPRLRLRLLTTRLALLWERLAGAFWLPLSLGGLALALAWSDLLPRLPGWLHAAILGLVALALLVTLGLGLRGLRWPTGAEVRHRLEARAPHRPLSGLDDHMARPDGTPDDPLSTALWQAHRRRLAEDARRLRAEGPAPTLPRRDPYGLRVAAALALVVTGAAAWDAPGERLDRALRPSLGGPAQPPTVDLWVTPPDYTGLAPLYRSTGGQEPAQAGADPQPITVPEGSALLVLIQGGDDPEIGLGDRMEDPEALADGSHRLETTLDPLSSGARLRVEDGTLDVADWPLTVQADRPPRVVFSEPPGEAGRWRLKVPFSAADDFGLATATLHFSRDGAPEQTRDLPLPGAGPQARREVTAAPLLDLAAHRWAGLAVDAFVTVTDAKGQSARTETRRVTLPERVFQHPVAQRIAALRRDLVIDGESRLAVAPDLEALAGRPAAYDHDIVVFMGLSTAARRLVFGDARDRDEVVDLLWNLALRVEDGDLAEADKALAEAEQALEKALAENAPAAEIQEKVDALRRAMQRYMQAMMQQMSPMGEMPPLPPGALTSQELDSMLQQLGALSELGARDAAQALLEQLRQRLSDLRNAQPMPSQALQQMREMMEKLGALSREQEELLNRTFREHRDAFQGNDARPGRRQDLLPPLLEGMTNPPGPRPPAGPAGQAEDHSPAPTGDLTDGARLAEDQEALRERLGDLMRALAERSGGQVPQTLGQAERRMRDASEALAGQAWAPATEAQGAALKALRDGQGQALQRMMQAMGAGMAILPGGGQPMGSDPMGRTPGGMEANGVKVPTDAAASRARDIMMELRRRSNDRQRPEAERDYIRRLLERF